MYGTLSNTFVQIKVPCRVRSDKLIARGVLQIQPDITWTFLLNGDYIITCSLLKEGVLFAAPNEFCHPVFSFTEHKCTPPKIIRYLLLYHNMLKNANLIKKGCLLESISPKTALKIVQILFIFLFNFLNFIIMIIYYI